MTAVKCLTKKVLKNLENAISKVELFIFNVTHLEAWRWLVRQPEPDEKHN